MGTYLSTPVLDKCWEEGEDFDNTVPVAWGVVDMQGWRKSMEDAHIVQTDVTLPHLPYQQKGAGGEIKDHAQVFAVFDGHGGPEVARFCQLYLVDVLTRQSEWMGGQKGKGEVDVGKALVNCFHAIDDLLNDPKRRLVLKLSFFVNCDFHSSRSEFIYLFLNHVYLTLSKFQHY
jgi:protein phosphatase 2C family protein 2/3